LTDSLIFFFQAEDGIRSPLVTGVQTCALPIFRRVRLTVLLPLRPEPAERQRAPAPERPAPVRVRRDDGRRPARRGHGARPGPDRSEERRVGKECSAWG